MYRSEYYTFFKFTIQVCRSNKSEFVVKADKNMSLFTCYFKVFFFFLHIPIPKEFLP